MMTVLLKGAHMKLQKSQYILKSSVKPLIPKAPTVSLGDSLLRLIRPKFAYTAKSVLRCLSYVLVSALVSLVTKQRLVVPRPICVRTVVLNRIRPRISSTVQLDRQR